MSITSANTLSNAKNPIKKEPKNAASAFSALFVNLQNFNNKILFWIL
jgi:hypothetical protein